MRIDLLIRSLDIGGAQRQLVAFACRAAAMGEDIRVITFYSEKNALAGRLLSAGIPLVDLGKRGRYDILIPTIRLRHWLADAPPDILLSYLPLANISAGLIGARPGMRRIWSIRNTGLHPAHGGFFRSMETGLERRLAVSADGAVFNSHAGKAAYAAQQYRFCQVDVVSNGIDIELFKPDAVAASELRRELGISAERIMVLHAGRFDPMKEHGVFLDAAACVAAEHPEAIFVLAGPGVEAQAISSVYPMDGLNPDNLIFLGPRLDMPALMSAADIFCLSSSDGEGFPNVLGEAMSSACPSVSTDAADSAFVLGGRDWVAPVRDAHALAAVLSRMLALAPEARRCIGQDNRRRIVENFSLDAMTRRLLDVLYRHRHKTAVAPGAH